VRGHKVMLSPDLAALYQVEPRALVQAVKRNADRFPIDFMFQLNETEFRHLKSQIVISSWGWAKRDDSGWHVTVDVQIRRSRGRADLISSRLPSP